MCQLQAYLFVYFFKWKMLNFFYVFYFFKKSCNMWPTGHVSQSMLSSLTGHVNVKNTGKLHLNMSFSLWLYIIQHICLFVFYFLRWIDILEWCPNVKWIFFIYPPTTRRPPCMFMRELTYSRGRHSFLSPPVILPTLKVQTSHQFCESLSPPLICCSTRLQINMLTAAYWLVGSNRGRIKFKYLLLERMRFLWFAVEGAFFYFKFWLSVGHVGIP